MATATGLTAERMLEIERASVVSARRENGELILTTRGGTDINVGDVTGSQGPIGPDGLPRYTWLKYADSPTSGMSDSPTNKNYIGLAYNKTSIIESNDYADYYWSLIRGPEGAQGVPGPSGENGEPTYVWIKYATDVTGSGMSDSPTNKDYIGFAYNKNTSVESSNPEDYSWSLIKGPKGDKGENGAQGIPGPAGANGEPLYTWVKYADSPTAGISDDPTGKDYIGLAYNKGTATESTNYSDYAWSLIKGPQGAQGVPGTPGADGLPRYVWIKYANDISGSGISDDPTGKDYIGLAYNKTTAVESNEPLDYTWSLYKGPAGNDGEDGRGIISSEIAYQASASGVLVPTGTWLTDPPTVSAGQYLWTRTKTTYNSAPYDVLSYSVGQMGQTGPAGANGTTITAAVVRYQLHTNGTTAPTGTWLSTPPSGSPGQWLWTRTVTSYSSGADTIAYSISLLGQTGPQGTAGTNGIDGRGITSSEITYQAASSGTVAPTGIWLSSVPLVSPSQFLWTRTRTFYSSAPTEVVSYSVGQMGATGVQGNQGIQGPAGTSYYTWLKYADSPTSGMSDDPTGKTYIGLAHNKTTATESNIYSDYTWALIKGEQGIQGLPGADGQPTYTWIKYGTSSTGAGISDDPTGKTYIGIAYNKTTIVESSNAADYSWSLIQGATGAPGESVTGQTVDYQLSSSGTVIPTGTWVNNPPAGSPGQYMWTRITFTYTTLPNSHAYSVSMLGNTGPTGATGATGATGNGISSATITYQSSSSGTVVPTGTWVSSPPVVSAGQYLWTRTVLTYTDTNTSTLYSVGQMGATGATGKGISSAVVTYQLHTNGTTAPTGTWASTPPAGSAGQYLWTRTITTYTDATTTTAYSVSMFGITGATGATGVTGNGISSAVITYQASSSGTVVPTGTWVSSPPVVSAGQYLWTRTVLTYTDTTTSTAYSVGQMGQTGPTGSTGATGKGISNTVTTYQLGTTGTTAPTGTWLSTPPSGSPGQYMWTRIIITYSDSTTSTSYSVGMLGQTGAAGTPAAIITLVATSQVLRSPATGGGTTPLTATVTGSTLNTTISVYEYSIDGGAFSATVPAGVSRTGNAVTITGSTMTASTIAVRMADSNGVAQSVTVSKIYDGAIGPTGNTGRGISSTDISYQASSSGTVVPTGTWVSSPPVVSAGQYLWTRTVFNYTTGSPSSTTHYSVGGMGSKIDTVTVTYQLSNSGTVAPSGTWTTDPQIQTESLPYLWTRTITTYVGGPSTTIAYSVSRRGISVSSVEMIYKEFAPKIFNSFEEQSNDLVEVIRNMTLNPEAISSGSTNESLIRWGWARTNITESDETLRPEPRLASYFRHTVGTGSVGGSRGIDWYQNMDVSPAVTNGPQVVAGRTYLISYYTRFSKSATATLPYRIHNGTTWLGGGTLKTLTIGTSWTRVYAIFTPTFSGSIAIRNQVDATGWTATDYIDQTGLLICESSTLQDWFSGEYSSDNDLEPAWVGTINSSPSILKGHPTSPSFEQVGLTGVASIQWYKTGSKSYRLIPNSINNNSYAGITLGDLGLEVGKTYTIFTTLKMFNPQTGSINSNARNISIGPSTVISNQAPNLAGEYLLTLVFTLDGISISLTSELMLNSGVTAGNGDIWYDDLIVIEGNVGLDVSTWISTMPSYNSDMILFRSEKVIFSDGSITYTAPKIEPLWSALNLANDARDNAEEALAIIDDHSLTIYGNNDDTGGLVGRIGILENDTSSNPQTPLGALIRSIGMTADGKNTTIRSFDGAINPEKYIAGDQWYQYNTNGNIVNFWMHNGSEWVETRLNSAIFGDVDAAVINSGFIHADRIDLNSIPRDRIDNLPALLEELQDLNGSGDIAKTLQRLTSQIVIGDGVIQIIAPSTDVSTDLHMELDATELAFYQGTNKVSYINDNKMFIRNAEIASTIGDSLVLAAHDVFKGGLGSLEGKVTVFRSI